MITTFISQFHLIRPWFLILLPFIWGLLFFLQKQRNQKDAWQEICDHPILELMQKTAQRHSNELSLSSLEYFWRSSKWYLLLYPLTALMIFAISGPSFRQLNMPIVHNEPPLIIALESSYTMLTEDIKPSRLQRAKYVINDLLTQKKEGQFALISYTDSAYAVTPLTNDKETILNLLSAVNPNIMPSEGNDTLAALEKAENLLTQAGFKSGDILLLTDKVDEEAAKNKIKQLATKNIRTSVLALGTAEGAPIKQASGLLKDRDGKIVFSKVDAQNLMEIAKLGAGKFAVIDEKRSDVQTLLNYLSNVEQIKEQKQNAQQSETKIYVDDGYYLLWLIIPMVALCFRRALLLAMMAGLFFIMPMNISPVYAANPEEKANAPSKPELPKTPSNKWLNPDQQVYKFLEKKEGASDPHVKPEQLKDAELKAAYLYKQQQFKEAAQNYKQQLDHQANAKNYYNYANALAQNGDLESSIKAYNQGIDLAKDDAKLLDDLKYNKKVVEDALKKQEEEDKKKEEQDKKDQKNNKNENKNQQNKDKQNQQDKDKQDKQNQKNEQKSDQQQNQENDKQQDPKNQQDKNEQNQKDKQNQANEQKSDQQQNQEQSEQDKQDQAAKDEQNKQNKALDQSQKDQPEKDKSGQEKSDKDKAEKEQEQEQAKEQEAQVNQDKTQEDQPVDEKKLIKQRFLEQVDSDPSVLLRNKFRREYQYQQGRK